MVVRFRGLSLSIKKPYRVGDEILFEGRGRRRGDRNSLRISFELLTLRVLYSLNALSSTYGGLPMMTSKPAIFHDAVELDEPMKRLMGLQPLGIGDLVWTWRNLSKVS